MFRKLPFPAAGSGLMRLAACILSVFAAAQSASGRSFSLDLRRPAAPQRQARLFSAASTAGEDGAIRSFDLDAGAADVGEVAEGDELSFTLFDDVTVKLTLKEAMPSPLGGDVFLAEAAGCEGVRSAVVLRTADGLTIDVQDFLNGRVYKVVSSPSGVKVSEIKPSHEGVCGCGALQHPPVAADGGSTAASTTVPGGSAAFREQVDTCVDILVAYDRNAAAYADSSGGGTTNFAQIAVQKMNAALANTKLDELFRFRLVGVTAVDVAESDVHEALYSIRDNRNGWRDIKTARDACGADIVTTLVDTGSVNGTTGVGWTLSPNDSITAFASSAYNVCSVRAVAQSNAMTHECGHNMGAGHSDKQYTQPGPQLYPYSAGFYFAAGDQAYCTIMAYGHENPSGAETTGIPYFSSPDYDYLGAPVGDLMHDNRRTIANTCQQVAMWRDPVVPMSYDVRFEPASGALVDGELSVALFPGKSGVEIRYTLDGSVPTLSSPLYVSPLVVSETVTVKAATVVNGICSLPFEATYYSKNDISHALGTHNIEWNVEGGWHVQTDYTVDGVGLATPGDAAGDVARLSTMFEGPATLAFDRLPGGYYSNSFKARVLCDGMQVWESDAWSADWAEASADIPEGMHEVVFEVETVYGPPDNSKGWFFALDNMRVYYTAKPVFEPATSSGADAAAVFFGEQMVVLSSPRDGCDIYYTLDGSDPNGERAIRYEGPFFISETTRVKAVAVQPGRGASAIAEGMFVEGSPPAPGEWTMNCDAAYEAAQANGRMVAELCWDLLGCGWSAALESVVTSPEFTTWAAANGVYLVADSWGRKGAASNPRFDSLYFQTDTYNNTQSIYYPTFVFASAWDPATCMGALVARDDDYFHSTWPWYEGTVESLIECFAWYMYDSPVAAPVPSAKDAFNRTFPFQVALVNPNSKGSIYYTLDGSAPTRENGIPYTGPVSIQKPGTVLKAVVWPDSTSAVSGVPLVVKYQSLSDAIGLDGVAWINDSAHPWTVRETSSGVKVSGYQDRTLSSGQVVSTIKAVVEGTGEFHYDYNFQPWYSTLEFKMNGQTVDTWHFVQILAGSTNISIKATGQTTLEWVYEYSSNDIPYDYLGVTMSGMAWTPEAPPAAVTGLAASNGKYIYGTLLRWDAVSNAKSYAVYRSDTATGSNMTLAGTTEKCQFWDSGCEPEKVYYYRVRAVNAFGDGPASQVVAGSRPAVGDMQTGGDASWTRSATDGSWRSGAIDNLQNTWLRQQVVGNGRLTFEWRVSSEDTYDPLVFYIDGVEQERISGECEWQERIYEVHGAGVHEFKWVYSKDWAAFSGADAGRVRGIQWSTVSFDVIMDLNGGNGEGHANVVFGARVGDLAKPSREGYTFAGWSSATGGDIIDPDTQITGDTYLCAQWNVNSYRVAFDPNGGAGTMQDQHFVYDAMQLLDPVAFTRKYRRFAGWAESPDGAPVYPDRAPIFNLSPHPDDVVVLYAVWEVSPDLLPDRIEFASGEVEACEGESAVVSVFGGNIATESSVSVHLTYQTASAADVDLAKGTLAVGGDTIANGLKFPLKLTWAAGEIGEKLLTIPVKADALYEGDEILTLQLVGASGMDVGEEPLCTVVLRDANEPSVPAGAVLYDGGCYTVDKKGNAVAKALPGSVFVAWVYDSNGKNYSTAATITEKLRKSKKVHPLFAPAAYMRTIVEDPATGTVKGQGSYAIGKTVSLVATPKKGYAFTGWKAAGGGEEAGGVLSLATTYKQTVGESGSTFVASFKKESELLRPVLTLADSTGETSSQEASGNDRTLSVGVTYPATLSVAAESKVSITKVAGLPAGLTFKSGKISGIPTKAGKFTAAVTVTLASNTKKTWTCKIPFTVVALPEWARGNFTGTVEMPPCESVVQETAPATMTVGSNGKISGKFVLGGTNWTFSASSFAKDSVVTGEVVRFTAATTASGTWKEKSGKTIVTKTVKSPIGFTLVADAERSSIASKTETGYFGEATDCAASGYVEFRRNAGVNVEKGGATAGGTVSLSVALGQAAAGKAVKATAKLAKGYALTGWYKITYGPEPGMATTNRVSQALAYSEKMAGEDVFLVAAFKKESELAKPQLTWGGEVWPEVLSTNLTVGVAYSAALSLDGEALASITKVAGLPAGLTWKSGKISGVPAKAGKFTVTVTAALSSNAKKTWTWKQPLAVVALPAYAKGTFTGFAGDAAGAPRGLATVTVAATGKISGKIVEYGTNWTISAASYTSREDGAFRCTNVAAKYTWSEKSGKKTVTKSISRTLSLSVSESFFGDAVLAAVDGEEIGVEDAMYFTAWQNRWSSDYKAVGEALFRTNAKTAYRTWSSVWAEGIGDYDTLSVKVTTAGAVTATFKFFKGTFDKKTNAPQYVSYTCSTTLVPRTAKGADEFSAVAPVFFAPVEATGFPGFFAEVEYPFTERTAAQP